MTPDYGNNINLIFIKLNTLLDPSKNFSNKSDNILSLSHYIAKRQYKEALKL